MDRKSDLVLFCPARMTAGEKLRILEPEGIPTKCPDIPVSLKRNTEVFPHHFL